MPRLGIMPQLTKEDIIKINTLPEVGTTLVEIIIDRVVREFPADKYNEEFQKPTLDDIEELFKRKPETEEKAFEIVTERVLKEIRK